LVRFDLVYDIFAGFFWSGFILFMIFLLGFGHGVSCLRYFSWVLVRVYLVYDIFAGFSSEFILFMIFLLGFGHGFSCL
jgi:hypothetical protein